MAGKIIILFTSPLPTAGQTDARRPLNTLARIIPFAGLRLRSTASAADGFIANALPGPRNRVPYLLVRVAAGRDTVSRTRGQGAVESTAAREELLLGFVSRTYEVTFEVRSTAVLRSRFIRRPRGLPERVSAVSRMYGIFRRILVSS